MTIYIAYKQAIGEHWIGGLVSPKYLEDNGYKYLYTLKSALEDWKKDCPEDWI